MNELGKQIQEINKNNGWKITTPETWEENEYKIPAILMLINSELAEALEEFRVNDKEKFEEEIADVIIRTLDLCVGLNIDIEKRVKEKMEKNRLRSYRHGNKRV